MTDAGTALQIVDWRRRVFALYAAVRTAAMTDVVESHQVWQAVRNELFATHPASPLLAEDRPGFRSLPVADYDPEWRFEVEITPAARAQRLEVETGTDGIVPFELLGHVAVADVGSLDVWRLATYGGGLFIPVRDALAGRDGGTYGGGRYVVDTVKGADLGARADGSGIVIDFNFAYNPSCAYDPSWACPLAPPGNVLGVEVPAGERSSGGGH
ncbi:MAG: hypothetical protein JWL72_1238 [Ilumatobacteraceae bacterium]|nr:hypothetical protein [Ilumatobacteraceae bacterium]MCU1387900.1 hypothetical protein [Ilumatobacteraceae bacterium]